MCSYYIAFVTFFIKDSNAKGGVMALGNASGVSIQKNWNSLYLTYNNQPSWQLLMLVFSI